MSEPVKLTCVVPSRLPAQAPYRLSDDTGYTIANMMPSTWVTHDPVTDIAAELAKDSWSRGVQFALLNERGEIMFAGPIGQK